MASLAGLPKSLLARSKIILEALEEDSITKKGIALDLFNFGEYEQQEEVQKQTKADQILKRLNEVDVNRLTPLEALNLLYELKEI